MSGYHAKSLMYVFSFERVSELIGSLFECEDENKKIHAIFSEGMQACCRVFVL